MNATGAKIENKLKQKLHKREINSIMNIEVAVVGMILYEVTTSLRKNP